jgi:hypothetical protein
VQVGRRLVSLVWYLMYFRDRSAPSTWAQPAPSLTKCNQQYDNRSGRFHVTILEDGSLSKELGSQAFEIQTRWPSTQMCLSSLGLSR